jgi:predicted DsbA family dithiol-disulfide isomerase
LSVGKDFRTQERIVQVEIWSDVVCPWCAIGKRRFETALAGFEHRDEVDVRYRSFELDPTTPRTVEGPPAGTATQRLADKYGVPLAQAEAMQQRVVDQAAGEGLDFRFDKARPGNTVDAHRLLHLAADGGRQAELKERLLLAYFTEGEPIGDVDTLVRLAGQAGLDQDEARSVLESDKYLADVREDQATARAFGISGVPFFVLDRKFGVSGAQPAEVLLDALRQAYAAAHPLSMVTTAQDGDTCTDDSCAV